ncbi:MAG: hypothetical protein E7677_05095 [Ruminococcaceae bacterium]|nr:hypothetical protein [Oscillospiraceae bacterium]
MHIMQMLLALTPVFFSALFLLCFFREKLKHHPIINYLFIAACAVFFFCWNYAAHELGWLEDGFMTLENISPFICTVILVTPFLHKKIRDFAYCAIAFLAFGMFLALYISPAAEYFSSLRQNTPFVYISEAACHLVMALYGFYLILVGRVKLNLKSFLKAIAFIYSAVIFGVFLNWCFHLSNFGMNMYGNYSIYFLDIFGSFTATFIAYLVGIFATILLGFLVGNFLDWISRPATKKPEAKEATSENSEATTQE